jgi:mycothiol synthase
VNVQVLGQLDQAQLGELAHLLARCETADGHPALPEPQRVAAARTDLGDNGNRVLLASGSDGLIGCGFLSPGVDGSVALHIAVDPAHRASGEIHGVLIERALTETSERTPLRLWAMRATEADDEAAARHSFTPERELLQMRVPLPLPEATVADSRPVATRPFAPGPDDQRWLETNNQAFAGHPEQGAWTLADLRTRLGAPWVDLDGFLVADDPDSNGLIGFCWTKVHTHAQPMLGEIYVIAVHPAHHGHGWGRALTVAGLMWMAGRGVHVGMLYTDASNVAAVSLYHSLGFTNDHIDRCYVHTPSPTP